MSIKLRNRATSQSRLVTAQANQTGVIQATFSASASFPARIVHQQPPQTMAGQLQNYGPPAPAGVQVFDADNNLIGYGPAFDPNGVFFGRPVGFTNVNEDWYVTNQPAVAGALVTAQAGGRYTWVVPVAGVQYAFDWQRKNRVTNVVIEGGSHAFIG